MYIERHFRRLAVLCTGAATLLAGPVAYAFELPPGLTKESLVCEVEEFPALAKDDEDSGSHGHKSLKRWHLRIGKSKFWIHRKLIGERLHYIDKTLTWFNEIQDPGFYVVNSHADTVTADPAYGEKCKEASDDPPMFASGEFVFAFSIHKIENANGSKTPHMIVYLPIRTDLTSPANYAQEFKLLLYHIEAKSEDCPEEDDAAQCKALVQLRMIWEDKTYTPHELVEAARPLIKDIVSLSPVDDEDKQKRKDSGRAFGDNQIKDHNGVIHGTLKN